MKVLLIGAGAVGQVYGRHLQLGGADVSFFVREKYAEACRAGLTMYKLTSKKKRDPVRFEGFGVLTTADEVRAQTWDQVWLCISSTALRGAWFDELAGAIGQATLITLQPGLEERAYLAERYPEERTVAGTITLISYQAPLPEESVPEPGVAYYFPPMAPNPFSGPADAVDAVVSTLKKGGCPAKRHKNAARFSAGPTAIFMPHLAALEANDWIFGKLSGSPLLAEAGEASRQAMVVVADHHKSGPPFARHFVRPTLLRLILWIAPKLMPMNLEIYLRYHFTKVGDQTRFLMDSYISRGRAAGLPVDALERLAETTWGTAKETS